MHRTRIKICGVCRPEDAALAAEAGADAVGLIFHPPSKRNVSIDVAKQILAALPPFVTPVGLFVDAGTEAVLRTARAIGLRHVQFNGRETPELVGEVAPLVVVKSVDVERGRFVDTLERWRRTKVAGLVLETANTGLAGGSGIANDWETVREAQRAGAFEGAPHIIAAGGLTPESVGDVVRSIRPYAVDVSSGVESSVGCKSEKKIRAFIRAVREADADVARA
jgi:phosphoribosylanthranilate isomerase